MTYTVSSGTLNSTIHTYPVNNIKLGGKGRKADGVRKKIVKWEDEEKVGEGKGDRSDKKRQRN